LRNNLFVEINGGHLVSNR